ncbi:MAG: hypothetical protein ACRELA_10270, partial [Candidatus Rokuibacteriota bacterium]
VEVTPLMTCVRCGGATSRTNGDAASGPDVARHAGDGGLSPGGPRLCQACHLADDVRALIGKASLTHGPGAG